MVVIEKLVFRVYIFNKICIYYFINKGLQIEKKIENDTEPSLVMHSCYC